jgi:predicted permease
MQLGNRAVIIGYSLWREKFAGDPRALAKTLILDGQAHTIIGVMPYEPPLDFVTDVQVWTPFVSTNEQLTARGDHYFSVLAKLNPHIGIAQAQSELDTIANHLAVAYPDADRGWSMHATLLKKYLVGDATAPLTILFCAVAFVLLIACANVSNLFLSRGWARRREFAVRAAIGASRAALLRQLAVECLLIALIGGICAVLAAAWAVHGLRVILPPGIPRINDVRMDSGVACFALATSLLAAFLSGLAPALLTSRQDVNTAIKESATRRHNLSGHNFLRQFLVVAEVALALVLLVGATLALQSFARISAFGLIILLR